jgi:hypothetical protein
VTAPEKQELKALFICTALYYGHEIPDDALPLYIADLDDLPFVAVAAAIGGLRRDPRVTKCPLPSMIRARLTPESNSDSEAVMVTGRVLEAISRFGPYRLEEAKAWIGSVGWILVSMEGGWEHLNAIESDQLPTMKAQWRQLAKALIDRGAANPGWKQLGEGDRSKDAGLTSFGDTLMRLTLRPEPTE